MTAFIKLLMLLIGLLACYFPAIAGARGRGSRKSWIGLFFVGLFVGIAAMILGHHLVGTFDPVLFSQFKGESFARQMTVNLLAMIVRVSIAFCFGSFLAALLYGKRQADSTSLLGLGSEINKRRPFQRL
jgi:heme/copper-type cytochrome/quinol oxidase subunit 1